MSAKVGLRGARAHHGARRCSACRRRDDRADRQLSGLYGYDPRSAAGAHDADPARAGADPRFGEWRAAIVPPLDSAARFEFARDRLRIGIPIPAATQLGADLFATAELRGRPAAPYRCADLPPPRRPAGGRNPGRAAAAPAGPMLPARRDRKLSRAFSIWAMAAACALPRSRAMFRSSVRLAGRQQRRIAVAIAAGSAGGRPAAQHHALRLPILSLKALALAKAGAMRAPRAGTRLYRRGGARLCGAGRRHPAVARSGRADRLGVPVAGTAGGRPVLAVAGDHRQFPRPVRDTGLRDLGGIALAWRVLRHRLARRIRGNALYRTIHGAGAGRGAGHRTAAWTAGLRRARGGAGAALPAGWLRPRNPAAAAEAGRMDGTLPPLDGAADGVDRAGAGLARLADRRRRMAGAGAGTRRSGNRRAGADRPVPAARPRGTLPLFAALLAALALGLALLPEPETPVGEAGASLLDPVASATPHWQRRAGRGGRCSSGSRPTGASPARSTNVSRSSARRHAPRSSRWALSRCAPTGRAATRKSAHAHAAGGRGRPALPVVRTRRGGRATAAGYAGSSGAAGAGDGSLCRLGRDRLVRGAACLDQFAGQRARIEDHASRAGHGGFDLARAGQHVHAGIVCRHRASQRQTPPIRTASICSRATWPLPISASTALAP